MDDQQCLLVTSLSTLICLSGNRALPDDGPADTIQPQTRSCVTRQCDRMVNSRIVQLALPYRIWEVHERSRLPPLTRRTTSPV